jgi:hypothetical protein
MNTTGHIKYLGGSFFTKWMAFSSAVTGVDAEEVAPILDQRVSGWIETNTNNTVRTSLSTSSTADYARYLDLLDAWRNTSGWTRTRVQVELAIFELARDRPNSSSVGKT